MGSSRGRQEHGVGGAVPALGLRPLAGRLVNPIGIGTWTMGGARLPDGEPYADYDQDEREIAAIRHSLSRGQNHVDTAQFYGAGHAEEIVGEAIRGLPREGLFVATKVWKSHARRSATPKAAEASLRRLGIDALDLLYAHYPWEAIPMREYLLGLADALRAGLTRAIAVSNFSLEQLREAVALSPVPIAANQVHYNLLERSWVTPPMREYCLEQGIAIVAYRPLERRLLADRAGSRLLELAGRLSCTPAQLALRWLLQQEGVHVIPKASSIRHIDENLGALGLQVRAEQLQDLDDLAG